MTTTASSRKSHFKTPSFSSISNFSSTFGSSPSSPEERLLPLSTQDSPPLSPASPSRQDRSLPLPRSVPSVRLGLVLRALGSKAKLVMRGNAPLLIVFFSCLLIFLGALSGTGYRDPDEVALVASSLLGGSAAGVQLDGSLIPVVDPEAEQGLSQRELEELWRGMGRGKKDGAWLKEARDKRETRRIAPAPVAVKNPPRKLVSKDEEEEEEEEDEEEEEEKVIVNIENDVKEKARVVREEDRRPRVVDIFDYTGHDFGTHEGAGGPDTPQKIEKVVKVKAALDEIVGGQTKEDI
ncbi:hypothetical protein BDY24DRAFT_439782 [Mrakia frigida]|uniref:uncharacterized protein n=1 Tax=Mrakia frigida TaxID=29902 RepID=UPI003FCC1181